MVKDIVDTGRIYALRPQHTALAKTADLIEEGVGLLVDLWKDLAQDVSNMLGRIRSSRERRGCRVTCVNRITGIRKASRCMLNPNLKGTNGNNYRPLAPQLDMSSRDLIGRGQARW